MFRHPIPTGRIFGPKLTISQTFYSGPQPPLLPFRLPQRPLVALRLPKRPLLALLLPKRDLLALLLPKRTLLPVRLVCVLFMGR